MLFGFHNLDISRCLFFVGLQGGLFYTMGRVIITPSTRLGSVGPLADQVGQDLPLPQLGRGVQVRWDLPLPQLGGQVWWDLPLPQLGRETRSGEIFDCPSWGGDQVWWDLRLPQLGGGGSGLVGSLTAPAGEGGTRSGEIFHCPSWGGGTRSDGIFHCPSWGGGARSDGISQGR